jgi:hypothetical protein
MGLAKSDRDRLATVMLSVESLKSSRPHLARDA